MFKLNLKIAWRNILKNKGYTFINVFGLALGLAGFIFILLYVNYEKSYDHWNAQLKDVYQVQEIDYWEIKNGNKVWLDEADRRLVDLFKSSVAQVSEITHVTMASDALSIILPNKEPFLQHNVAVASPTFFSVFPFKFIYGSATTALNKPGSVVVKESFAKGHFGNINPIGKVIQIKEQTQTKRDHFIITGVVAEPETPSTVNFEILKFDESPQLNDTFYSRKQIYIKTKGDVSLTILNQTLKAIYYPFKVALLKRQKLQLEEFIANEIKPDVQVVPLQEVHVKPLIGESWLDLIKPVILLSTLLLLISIINFVNMFTAQAVARAKEVGVKKVIGANRKSIIFQYLLETALQCIIAIMLSVILLEGLLPHLNGVFNLSLSFSTHDQSLIIIEFLGLFVLITLLSGCYPAFFLSSYHPQDVLKGNFFTSVKGRNLRSILVGLQFVIAIGFFISIMIIAKQMSYIENRDPGFSAQSVIHIKAKFDKNIAAQIKAIDGVKYVGSNNGMISRDQKMTGNYKYKNESNELNTVLVNFEGLQALNVKLIKGRLFESNNVQDSINTVVLNESLDKKYGGNMVGKFILVNDSIPSQVIGIVKDIQVSGFENVILPTVYTAARDNATGYPNTGGNYVISYEGLKQKSILASIHQIWKRHSPAYPLTFSFVQDDLAKVLINHKRFKDMVELFSFLSISLSLIGLFSLAAFITRQRKKEIAIRKILGAGHKTLFLLLNKGYFWMVLSANIISWPLIYSTVNIWLRGFAYRIDLPFIPFVIAFVVSILVTIITVSIQVKNAVQANPVDALKYK